MSINIYVQGISWAPCIKTYVYKHTHIYIYIYECTHICLMYVSSAVYKHICI